MARATQDDLIINNDHEIVDQEQDLDDLNLIPLSRGERVRKHFITIEPLVFLLFFAVNLSCKWIDF